MHSDGRDEHLLVVGRVVVGAGDACMVEKAPRGQCAMVYSFAPNVGGLAPLCFRDFRLAVEQGLVLRLGDFHHLALQPLHSGPCRMLVQEPHFQKKVRWVRLFLVRPMVVRASPPVRPPLCCCHHLCELDMSGMGLLLSRLSLPSRRR